MSKLIEHQLLTNCKTLFDPKNKSHINLLKQFMIETRWGNPCPFILEDPYLTIPDMIKDKYVKYQLGIPS